MRNCQTSVFKSAKWLHEIADIDINEYLDTPTIDAITLSLIIETSTDADEIMGAIPMFNYFIAYTEDGKMIAEQMVNEMSYDRWLVLLSTRIDVMRETVKLMRWLRNAPENLESIVKYIVQDLTAIEIFADLWIKFEWDFTTEVIFAIQHSYSGWKILKRVDAINSFDLINELKSRSINEWRMNNALIGTNGSALEYLIWLDAINEDGLHTTIDTLNRQQLWEVVLGNPAAEPIIDYALAHFLKVQPGRFISISDMKKWIFPLIGPQSSISKYVSAIDINLYRFARSFFSNPAAIDMIVEWLRDDNYVTSAILDGLITIAASNDKDAALKAMYVINNTRNICDDTNVAIIQLLNDSHWINLAQSPYGRQFVLEQMETNMIIRLECLFEESKIVPYWTFDIELNEWQIENLTEETVENLDLNQSFIDQTFMFAEILTYENWSILLQTKQGVLLGLGHVEYVGNAGCVHILLRSKFISQEDIVQICEEYEECNELDDNDFIAIISRPDAIDIDPKHAFEARFELTQEFLQVWYNPDRLIEVANRNNMNMRSYLEMVG